MNDIYSFYQLISKYQIEIPIIQRDYAQGRGNTKATDVRKSLVEKMKNVVENEKETLFFDFVYGRVDGSKFIPFDGQQRLTTLFLFHKYVFEKCQSSSDCSHKFKCICIDILGRFSYATRQSSREFCEKLVQEYVIPSDDKEVSENIKNQSWFYPDWQKDPTVMGMLTMLDEIHNQMKTIENFKTIAERLTSGCNCPITFHFVDMGEHKLSDETYVKMNARGKMLTPFENFKASLEQYLKDKKESKLAERFESGVDGTWLDLFWDVVNKGNKEKELPDSWMMSFFNRHFMNVWRCWYAQNQNADNDKFNKRIIDDMPLYPTKDDFVSWDVYNEILNKCGVGECLIPIFNICDVLCEKESNFDNRCQAVWNRGTGVEEKKLWNVYTGIINNNNRETYPSRVAFYALMKYFESNAATSQLDQWMRIVWNIIENSTIDSEDTYHAALKLINELSEHSHEIYQYLSNPEANIKSKHAEDQVKEEIAKAKQILNNDCDCVTNKRFGESWEDAINKAEKYAFFKGAIRFLFQDEKGNVNWCDFDKKWGNAQRYFDENGVRKDYQVPITKALVIQCNKWNDQLYDKQVFNPNASTWKWILCSSTWKISVHNILLADSLNNIKPSDSLNDSNANQFIVPILDILPYKVFVETEPTGRFRWNGMLGYYKPHGQYAITFDWGGSRRNKILRELIDRSNGEGFRFEIQNEKAGNFWWGWNIQFKYKNTRFQWHSNGFVRIIDETSDARPILKNIEAGDKKENWYFFYTNGIDDSTSFLEKLDCFIAQAGTSDSEKLICENCQEKICEQTE